MEINYTDMSKNNGRIIHADSAENMLQNIKVSSKLRQGATLMGEIWSAENSNWDISIYKNQNQKDEWKQTQF